MATAAGKVTTARLTLGTVVLAEIPQDAKTHPDGTPVAVPARRKRTAVRAIVTRVERGVVDLMAALDRDGEPVQVRTPALSGHQTWWLAPSPR
jgi:hypothetical protein